MRALSVRQPWATWIARGEKSIETRPWQTRHRGELLICAARNLADLFGLPAEDFQVGVALCVVDVLGCRPLQLEDHAACIGAGATPRHRACIRAANYGWQLGTVARLREPFAVRGKQGLFEVALPAGAVEFEP